MPTLPNGFTPTVAAYSHDGPGGVMRTEVAGGMARYALDWDRGAQKFNVTLILAADQLSVWLAFYHHIIRKGALAFDMPLDSGLGVSTHTVHLVPGSYGVTALGGAASVAFSVECQNAAYALSDAAVAAYGLSAATLPAGFTPVIAQYAYGGPDGVLRDDIAGGCAAYALEWDRGVQKFSVTLILDKAKFALWTVWYHRLIGKGARTFSMPLDSGFGPLPHACNIIPGSYSATRTEGIAMVVSFSVEAESGAYDFNATDAQNMIDFYNAGGTGALLARLAQFALVDMRLLP